MKTEHRSMLCLPAARIARASPATRKAPRRRSSSTTASDRRSRRPLRRAGSRLCSRAGLKPNSSRSIGRRRCRGLEEREPRRRDGGLGFASPSGRNIPLKIIYWNSNDAHRRGSRRRRPRRSSDLQDIGKAQKIGAASGTCAQVRSVPACEEGRCRLRQAQHRQHPGAALPELVHELDRCRIAWAPYSLMLDAEGYRVVNWDRTRRCGHLPAHDGTSAGLPQSPPEIQARSFSRSTRWPPRRWPGTRRLRP